MPPIDKKENAIAIGDFKAGYKIVDRSGINLLYVILTLKSLL